MNESSNVISFRRKNASVLSIRGTRASIQNSQLLTSTGSPTLDFFIGGGLAVGTLCLIEEDYYSTYSTILMKYFLAEGITNGHSLFLTSGNKDSNQMLKELPAAKTTERNLDVLPSDSQSHDDLKIAWRYKNKSSSESVKIGSHNYSYDLSNTMSEDMLKNNAVFTWDVTECNGQCKKYTNFIEHPYSDVLNEIKSYICTNGYKTSSKDCKNILRIGISSISTPLWNCSEEKCLNLLKFMYTLKSVLRSSFAVAVVSVPCFISQDKVLSQRLRQICDTVISLESFVGSNKKSNPLFKDFDGLLHIVKLPVLNTFMHQLPTSDLAFKLRKRGLTIERLHLPPDLEESSAPDGSLMTSGGCSGQRSFDF